MWSAYDVGSASFTHPYIASPTSHLILQPFRRFTHVTAHFPFLPLQSSAHSPTLPQLHLRHRSFYNPSVASPTSQFILQPFFRFSYVTSSWVNSPGEPATVHRPLVLLEICPCGPSKNTEENLKCRSIAKISEFGNDTWQSPFTFSQYWHFMQFIILPIYRHPTLLSATKEGFKALRTWYFSLSFPCTVHLAPRT